MVLRVHLDIVPCIINLSFVNHLDAVIAMASEMLGLLLRQYTIYLNESKKDFEIYSLQVDAGSYPTQSFKPSFSIS